MSKYSIRENVTENDTGELKEYSELMQELLFHRGLKTAKQAEVFLNPDYDNHTHDPFLLKDMKKVVSRILNAIDEKQKIVIYSDYDCDGIPGGVILHDFFKKIGYKNFSNYIPHRHEEGYGLNADALEQFAKDKVRLVITVDCGISDASHIKRAKELGIDVIITDHHLPSGKLPQAYAILNPKQKSDKYPYKEISGANIAFKLVQALIKKGDFEIKEGWEKWLLDMAGLATIADMVPLLDENRVFAYYGMKVLRKSPRPGLMKLCRKMKIDQRYLNEDDIGFMLVPRINAASRMDVPDDAFELLATEDEVEADRLSAHLNKINNERKGIVAGIVKEIKKKITKLDTLRSVIVMGDPRWKPALLGLVANTVVDEYKRPVFLWGRDNGSNLKGSCRSDGSVNLVELMSSAGKTLIEYGGHVFSGGFSVSVENVHNLEDVLCGSYEKMKINNSEDIKEFIDKKLLIDDVNWDTYKIIEQLAPFGIGNPKPLFLFENIEITEVRHFGREEGHLQLSFENSNGKKINAIGFFVKSNSFGANLDKGRKINLIATMEKSTFRNFPELRLRIVDVI
ncbi:MAG: single-stranded-DNA-specific exonuclease RecJ [Candidatus Pacebacteria bacterium]|jgi:single-stranded-DNA-specific exonuclease|nr:single-stranded-DNA-specific exonuclease RecJ [Candidatus Paceibacterota bacterium]|tara:strand:+ start:9706 stop:11409 length:1704 start_codon:yes stop_codon:yes gene_type:complete